MSLVILPQARAQDHLNKLSDTQLTNLAADWSSLDEAQRSQLIQETQQRMQPQSAAKSRANGDSQATSLAPQQTTQRRRYGRLIRRSDGTVVRSVVQIETRTVRVQEGDRRRAYGMGFEQRHDRKYPPTITPVSGPSAVLPGGPERSPSSN